MRYYSESDLSKWFDPVELSQFIDKYNSNSLNVRLCRECPYFEPDHPSIDTDGEFGYCSLKTDFYVLDDEPINWYFTDINGFCREDDIDD